MLLGTPLGTLWPTLGRLWGSLGRLWATFWFHLIEKLDEKERCHNMWGLSTPRAPKELVQNLKKVSWSRSKRFSDRFAPYVACAKLYTFSMVSACAPDPYALKTLSKLRCTLGIFLKSICLFFWGVLRAMVPWCHSGAIIMNT